MKKSMVFMEFLCFLGLVCVGFVMLPLCALWWGKSKAFNNPSIVRNRYACDTLGPANKPERWVKNDAR